MQLQVLLQGVSWALNFSAIRYPSLKQRLREKEFVAQVKVKDNSVGRHYMFGQGRVAARAGIHVDR